MLETMPLVNLDNPTIIGPGSEWFWAMAQLVVVVVSLLAVYRQLKAQGAANAFARISSIQRHWESKTLAQARLRTALRLRYSNEKGLDAGALIVCEFMDDIWDLYEQGFLTRDVAVGNWGYSAYNWWQLLGPAVEFQRLADGEMASSNFESFAAFAGKMMLENGLALAEFDEPTRRRYLDRAIRRNTEILEIFAAAESNNIPGPPAEPLDPPIGEIAG